MHGAVRQLRCARWRRGSPPCSLIPCCSLEVLLFGVAAARGRREHAHWPLAARGPSSACSPGHVVLASFSHMKLRVCRRGRARCPPCPSRSPALLHARCSATQVGGCSPCSLLAEGTGARQPCHHARCPTPFVHARCSPTRA
ncbi:hypothetical protein Dimus_038773 [Dionaea muscipula]